MIGLTALFYRLKSHTRALSANLYLHWCNVSWPFVKPFYFQNTCFPVWLIACRKGLLALLLLLCRHQIRACLYLHIGAKRVRHMISSSYISIHSDQAGRVRQAYHSTFYSSNQMVRFGEHNLRAHCSEYLLVLVSWYVHFPHSHSLPINWSGLGWISWEWRFDRAVETRILLLPCRQNSSLIFGERPPDNRSLQLHAWLFEWLNCAWFLWWRRSTDMHACFARISSNSWYAPATMLDELQIMTLSY